MKNDNLDKEIQDGCFTSLLLLIVIVIFFIFMFRKLFF